MNDVEVYELLERAEYIMRWINFGTFNMNGQAFDNNVYQVIGMLKTLVEERKTRGN